MSKKIYFIFCIIFVSLFLELSLRYLLGPPNKKMIANFYQSTPYNIYSNEQLDKDIKFRHEFHGGNCVHLGLASSKLNWNPRFGYQDKKVDIDCVNKIFTKKTKNIIFFGGSVMANAETPNYLSSVEYFAFKNNIDEYRSINLGESGARLSNHLSMFLEYVPKINNIHALFFLDGINEFNSIKYNGDPKDDFFWTAGVNKRVHSPLSFFSDIIIDRSKTLEIIFIRLLNYKSSRIAVNREVNNKDIESTVKEYRYRKEIIKKLCQQYNIKCFFSIHPSFYLVKGLISKSDKEIRNFFTKNFPFNQKIFEYGYNLILNDEDVYDLSGIFDNKNEIYFDDAHTNITGSKILGEEIFKIIKSN